MDECHRLDELAYEARRLVARLEDAARHAATDRRRIRYEDAALGATARYIRRVRATSTALQAANRCPMCYEPDCTCAADYRPNLQFLTTAA